MPATVMSISDDQPTMVRLATSGDAGPNSALSQELGYPTSAVEVRRRLDRLLAEQDHAVCVAVRPASGEVMCWIHIFVRKLLRVDRHAETGGLVVAENHRDRGIGRLLMMEAECWARAQNCTAVSVHSNLERRAAHRFCRKLGYDQAKAQGVFHKTL